MIKILTALRSKGVFLTLDATGENISIKGNIRNLTEEDKNGIRLSKSEIIGFLKEQKQHTQHIPSGTLTGDTLDLSPNQKSIWVYEKIEGPGSAYIIPGIYEFEMPGFDQNKFYHAVNLLVQQTDVLRTLFIEEDGQPKQRILPSVDITKHVQVIDITGADADKEVQAEIDRRYATPFDLSAKPLWEIVLFRLPQSQFRFFLKVHHLIADGESLNLIIRRTLEIYSGTETIRPQNEISLQYSDFVHWINNRDNLKASSDFWKKDLENYEDDFRIPFDFADGGKRSFEGKELHYLFAADTSKNLQQYTAGHKLSVASVFTGAAAIVLSKWGRKNDIVVGTPAAGRNHPQLAGTIGNFVNTLPLRIGIDYYADVNTYLQGIQQKYHEVLDHQLYPFGNILEDINYQYKQDEFPLFNVMISVPTNQRIDSFEEKIHINRKASLYDITFTFMQAKDDFKVITEYNAAKFEEATIYDITSQVERVLSVFFENKISNLTEVKLLTPAQERDVMERHCRSNWPVQPETNHIVESFRKRVAEYPDNIIVSYDDDKRTYAQFYDEVALLGSYLIEKGVKRGDPVCVVLPKSITQFTCIWALWSIGATYVPADTENPRDRIDAIIDDCQPRVVIDRDFMKAYKAIENKTALPNFYDIQPPLPQNTAYMVYTSGSTGKPKGVMVSHRNTVIKLYEFIKALNIDATSVTITSTSLVFDVSMLEVAMPVLTGGRVVIADETKTTDVQMFINYATSQGVTILQGTPTYFALFMKDLDRIGPAKVNNTVKHICIGGESLNAALVKRFGDMIPKVSINNHCGPTETCIDAIASYGVKTFEKNILGKPIGNTEAYVVDEFDNLLPANMIGEMIVGGPGVGQGYWNNLELTRERFRKTALSPELTYDSGDLVKRTRDGFIEYIGRKDKQLKIRGYRVELDEINKNILQIPNVLDVYTGMYNNLLVSWVSTNKKITEEEVVTALTAKLPSYMIPMAVEFLSTLPMTVNGKVDVSRLPVPQKSKRAYEAPETQLQKELAAVIGEMLSVPDIGINDNFFELGGHSLHMVRIANQLNVQYDTSIRIRDLFNNNTIKMVADLIEESKGVYDKQVIVPRYEFEGKLAPTSPSQYRLWLSSKLGGTVAYNMPLVFNVRGEFDMECFRKSVRDMIDRQESLRTCFKQMPNGDLMQYIYDTDEFMEMLPIPYKDYFVGDDDAITRETSHITQLPFDLDNGPLMMVGVYKVSDNLHAVYMCMHHTIGDGWSMEVVFNELIRNYNAYVFTGKPFEYEPLSIRYRDYAKWYRENLERFLNDQSSFWMKRFAKPQPEYTFPFEKGRPVKKTYDGAAIEMWTSEALYDKINEYAQQHTHTPFGVVLAIFKTLVYKYTGVNDVTTGTPISGRFNQQTERMIGLFLNTLAMRSEFDIDDTFTNIINNENQMIKETHDNQFFQINEIITRLNMKVPVGHTPLFDIMFMFQNQTGLGISKDEDDSTGLKLGRRNFIGASNQFDIAFAFTALDGRFEINMGYNTNIYEDDHMRNMIVDLLYVVDKVLDNTNITVREFYEKVEYTFLTDKPIIFKTLGEQKAATTTAAAPAVTLCATVEVGAPVKQDASLKVKKQMRDVLLNYVSGEFNNDTDYFASGGNSLGAIQAVNDLNDALGTQMTIIDFYNNPTIDQLYNSLVENGSLAASEETTETVAVPAPAAGGIDPVKEKIRNVLLNYVSGEFNYDTDYFASGGNSLGAIQAVNDLNDALGTQLTIIDFYNSPTINQLRTLVGDDVVVEAPAAAPVEADNDPVKAAMLKVLLNYVSGEFNYDTDYFASGGNSLGAIQAVNDLNDALGTQLTIIDFYNSPTINQLRTLVGDTATVAATPEPVAQVAEKPVEVAISKPVVPELTRDIPVESEKDMVMVMNKHDKNLPDIFAFPPILGTGLIFKPMGDILNGRFNVYGMSIPLLKDRSNIIPDLSYLFAKEILKRKQDDDVIFLLGYSIGVNLVFEVAKILEQQGREVSIIMIDRGPQSNVGGEWTDEQIQEVVDNHMPLIAQLAVKGEEGLFVERVKQLIHGANGFLVEGKINSRIYAFECKGNPMNGYMNEWANYSTKGQELNYLEGHHYEAMQPKNLQQIVQIIKKAKDERTSIH